MYYTIGDKFPEFSCEAVDIDNTLIDVEYLQEDMWSVVYFYPKDFTFICPTEIAGMDNLVDEATVVGISGDNEFCKLAWKNSNVIIQNIRHSLAADCGLKLSRELGIVNEEEGVC